ncbi:immunoglobulin-like domain-containing receptor 2 isoform X3 [Oryzias melastigma]|uniref:Immunoglobulin-like domain-containing receptor 2 n=1 Tax=Oryzias melastigma TaxID=30732 RepID=A0A3B3DH47_ORYME|nr:immunoglobulin-like domain-containing receptor 2 isoform X3 [Oryzias melastigma]
MFMNPSRTIWRLFLTPASWWIFTICLGGIFLPSCSGVHVFVRDEKKYAILFQSVVLPCQYTSVSTQTAVVQWVYKSYCRDRTRDSFSITDSLNGGVSGTGLSGRNGVITGSYEAGRTMGYLDCSDNSRTVRTVASISGSSVTLSEFYKNRDISIINKADLRIGRVKWGDSGVYICKVVISDDLEGQNEASAELLVLEWVFVVAVVFGSVLLLVLVGVCWCQCCPHSCCCYVSCWCCPDTCCCPRHLYEAGKGIRSGASSPQAPSYPPYFVSGVPTMVPIAPPSLVDNVSSVQPTNGSLVTTVPVHAVGVPYCVPSPDHDSLRVLQYVEKQLAHLNPSRSISRQSSSHSELSSLHEGDTAFRQNYQTVQQKALPVIPDHDPQPEPQRSCEVHSPETQRHHNKHSSPHRYRHDPASDPHDCQDEPLLPRRYSDDPPPSSRSNRTGRNQWQPGPHEEEKYNRWNPRSEHLHRKAYRTTGRRGSLVELEEFADSYEQRGDRGARRREQEREDYETELVEFRGYPCYRNGPPQYYHDSEKDLDDDDNHEEHSRHYKQNRHNISPLHSPKKRRGTWEKEVNVPPPPTTGPQLTVFEEKDYDATFLNSLLERKAKLRGVGHGRSRSRSEDDSDTPSKGSSRKGSRESNLQCSHIASSRPETSSRPPSADTERARGDRPSPRPPQASTHSSQPSAHSLSSRREEHREKGHKVNTLLSRDSLIV